MNFILINSRPELQNEKTFFDFISAYYNGKKLSKCLIKKINDIISMSPEVNQLEFE